MTYRSEVTFAVGERRASDVAAESGTLGSATTPKSRPSVETTGAPRIIGVDDRGWSAQRVQEFAIDSGVEVWRRSKVGGIVGLEYCQPERLVPPDEVSVVGTHLCEDLDSAGRAVTKNRRNRAVGIDDVTTSIDDIGWPR